MNRVGLIIFGDLIAFWLSFLVIIFVRFGELKFATAISIHAVPFTILYFSWVLLFFLFGLYDLLNVKPTIPNLNRFGMALSASLIVGIFLFYFVPVFGISPKTNLVFQVIGFGLISFIARRVIYVIFSEKVTRSVVLIGSSPDMERLKNAISNNPQLGLNIASQVKSFEEAIKKFSTIKNFVFIFEEIPNEVLKENIVDLYKKKTEIISVAQAYERYLYKIPVNYINQSWVIENISVRESFFCLVTEKIINILVSLTVLIICSPILAIAILARLLEDGRPVLIRQKRVGRSGKIFTLYKIRSMIVLSPDGSAETTNVQWANNKDARITKVGHVLRKTHIDEIPQMINILKGDISLVGPRPERPEFVAMLEQHIPYYSFRHVVRPGFTGWAQIKYRYANTVEDSKEKFEYDLYYIKNKNLFLDFGIILRTIQIIFTH